MSAGIATVAYAILIAGLFWLDRDPKARTSAALWIPVSWMVLASSRSVSEWLMAGHPIGPMSNADQLAMEGSVTDRIVYTGLLAVGLAVLVKRSNRVNRLLLENGAVLLFFLYCAISLVWSDYPDVAFKRWTKALGDLVMVLVVISDAAPYQALKKLLATITFLLIPVSVLLIKYYPAIGKGYGRWDYNAIYFGVTTNKNALGAICLFLGTASLWRFLTAYHESKSAFRKRQLFAHGSILAMVFWLFWMADSTTALACFLLATVVMMAARSRAVLSRPPVIHVLITTALSVSVMVLLLGLDPTILRAMGKDSTLTDRTRLWSTVLPLTGNPLLGTGFESFWLGPRLQKIWSSFSWQPFEAHNGYIEIYLNLGWIGIALLSIVLFRGYKTTIAAWRRNQPASDLMLAYFVVALVYNFTEAALFRMMTPAWVFLLLALTVTSLKPAHANRQLLQPVPTASGTTGRTTRQGVVSGEFV